MLVGASMVRLVPMSEEEYQEAMGRAIARHAASSLKRGDCREEAALEESRRQLTGYRPQGRSTPDWFFMKVIDEATGDRVGEAWYSVKDQGGKVHFWVDWLTIEPPFQRRGFATEVLEKLAEEARRRGADRMALNVMSDNLGAVALYGKLGFVTISMGMVRDLSRSA